MPRATNHILLAFAVALLLAPKATIHAASELVLSRKFHVSELRNMPCLPPHSGMCFEKQEYPEEHAIEWQVRLQTPPDSESPIYANVNSADFEVYFPSEQGVSLHWSTGSHSEVTDFCPRTEALVVGSPFVLESFGGRSSDGVMPYFNLATKGGGLIVAVGWSGDWRASFESLDGGRVRITAGLKRSRFKLPAGERVRLPTVLVMSYRGDWLSGQNQFRRLMLRHFTPKSHTHMDLMPVAASVHGMLGFNATTEDKLTTLATEIAALNLPLDTFWLDAGWNRGGFPLGQGNPNADPLRFTHGLGPVGKAVAKTGMKFLVWFEPERAMRGTWLDRKHPDWLLLPSNTPPDLHYQEKDGFRLLDLGNSDARRWALENISRQIHEAGISVYRQDFNEYPAFFWQTGEPPDKVGLREVRYVNGLYKFLDELALRHPDLILDNCASGGRRLDFEMMRRCVVLWRSDSCWDDKSFPRNVQAMTHGLSLWLPLHGLGAHTTDDAALRSGMGACASYAINFRDPAAVAALGRHLVRYLKVRPLFAADFYPLTKWSDDPDNWLAFQFHDPAKSEGIVQAFHGTNASQRKHTLKLRGLEPSKQYLITNWDTPAVPMRYSGSELLNAGIDILAHDAKQAVVLHYITDPKSKLHLKNTPKPDYGRKVPQSVSGRVTSGSKPIGAAGVSVTDGYSVTKTDADGRYSLKPSPAAVFIYITRPARHDVVGSWYKPVAENVDFTLKPAEQSEDEYTFVHMSDTHISSDPRGLRGLSRFVDEVNSLDPRPRFVFNTGDLVNLDKKLKAPPATGHKYFRNYTGIMNHLSMPYYNVAGDHTDSSYRLDDFPLGDHRAGKALYWEYLGPNFFSFEYGKIHFVSVDFVYHLKDKISHNLLPGHLKWLREDMANRTPGTFVVTGSENTLDTYNPTFGEIARGNDVRLQLVGDDHIVAYNDRKVPFRVGGAISGTWWSGPCADLSPRGYMIYRVRGERMDCFYKGIDRRVAITSPHYGSALKGKVILRAHLVQPGDGEKLECSIHGSVWKTMREVARPHHRAVYETIYDSSTTDDGLITLKVRSVPDGEERSRVFVVHNDNDPTPLAKGAMLSFTVGDIWPSKKPPRNAVDVVLNGQVVGRIEAGRRKSYSFAIDADVLRRVNVLAFAFANENDGMVVTHPMLKIGEKMLEDPRGAAIRKVRAGHWGQAATAAMGFTVGKGPNEHSFALAQDTFYFVLDPTD